MSRYAYVTKRLAPMGYVAITKPFARALYEHGHAITLCGNNVNAYHVFKGWHLGCTSGDGATAQSYAYPREAFDSILASFLFYPEPELGTYAVFYVKASAIAARCRTCGEGGHQIAGQCVLCATRPSTAGK